MTFEVMDAEHRLAEREAERIRDARADQKRSRESRPARVRDRVDVAHVEAGTFEHVLHERQHPTDVIARGEFGDDATERFMERGLRMQRIGEKTALGVVERDAGFVARRLDAENAYGLHRACRWEGYVGVRTPDASMRQLATLVARRVEVLYLPIAESRVTKRENRYMTSVRVRENEPFEAALRRFKRTIEKTGLLTELRAREFYEKPTSERKRKKAAAVKRHYKRLRSQQLPPKLY